MSKTQRARQGNGSTSRSLLYRLKREDASAWNQMVHLYSPLIVHWCKKSDLDPAECEDILQEVFRSVFHGIEQFRKERPTDTFRGWLRTITRHRITDLIRKRWMHPKGVGGTDAQAKWNQLIHQNESAPACADDDDSPSVLRLMYGRAIEMIREEFAESTWQAFWRTAVDGQPASTVGEELNMRAGTVRVAKSRVLKRLRQQLGEFSCLEVEEEDENIEP